MPTKAQTSQEEALDALTDILKDMHAKDEVRVEAAKTILNRPRFFMGPDVKEA